MSQFQKVERDEMNGITLYDCMECGHIVPVPDDGSVPEDYHPVSRCPVHGYFCGEQSCPRC